MNEPRCVGFDVNELTDITAIKNDVQELREVQRNMQTSLNDHQQLLRGLHQNQTLGKLEFVIIQRAVIKTIPSVFSVFVLSQCYMPVLEINALTD